MQTNLEEEDDIEALVNASKNTVTKKLGNY